MRVPDKLFAFLLLFLPCALLIAITMASADLRARITMAAVVGLGALGVGLLVRSARRRVARGVAELARSHPGWTIVPVALTESLVSDIRRAGLPPKTSMGLLAYDPTGVEVWIMQPRMTKVAGYGWRDIAGVREQHIASGKGAAMRGVSFLLASGVHVDLLPAGVQAHSEGGPGDKITDLVAALQHSLRDASRPGQHN